MGTKVRSNYIPYIRNSFFYLFIFYLSILYWFSHTSTWIHHGYTCLPNPEPSSLLPLHTVPLGHPSAPAPSILYPASNLDWRFVSYMILYMFQCHSLKSSHPLPLPQSPKLILNVKKKKVYRLKVKGYNKIYYENTNLKKAQVYNIRSWFKNKEYY